MAVRYTEEQLNTVDKSLLIQMVLNQQEQLETLTAEVRSLNRWFWQTETDTLVNGIFRV